MRAALGRDEVGNIVYAVSGCAYTIPNATLYALDTVSGTLLNTQMVPCSVGGIVPFQGMLILNSRAFYSGHLLQAFASTPSYQMSIAPNQLVAFAGGSLQAQMTVTSSYNFTDTVHLSVSSLPEGIQRFFSTVDAPRTGTVTLTLSLVPNLKLIGKVPITVAGTTASAQKSASMQLIIHPSAPPIFLPLITR